MKKFVFSMQKLMDFKNQILKKEKNTLADFRKNLAELIEQRNSLVFLRKEKNKELIDRINEGLSPQHIAFHKNYIHSLTDRIKEIDNRIILAERKIKTQLDVVIEVTKEVDSLEKLQKKQFEEYKKLETKENELFIEEFVSHKSYAEA